MYELLIAVHIFTCLLMILVVLLQAGRGAGLSVFGGGGEAVFASPSGSSFLKKFTAILAATFAMTSLMLTLLQGRVGNRSVTRTPVKVPYSDQGAPGQPAGVPAPTADAQAPAPAAVPTAADKKDAAPKVEKETPKDEKK
jgi:preprotein translocase subunit SecG